LESQTGGTMRSMETIADPRTPPRSCGVAAALDILGDRWSLLIVREVFFGNRRFSTIVDAISAPRDRIAARLKSLVQDGVLERRPYQESPPRAEYWLTPAGLELAPVLVSLFAWGSRWGAMSGQMTLHHGTHPLRPALICTECGEVVTSGSLTRHRDDGVEQEVPPAL
jgi:DNA-binding HxlR family transcriptional regulator